MTAQRDCAMINRPMMADDSRDIQGMTETV